MASKRMLSRDVTESDEYISLSFAAQALYVQLSVAADDDGLLNSALKAMNTIGVGEQVLDELEEHGLIIRFPSSKVIAITHWRVNNYIQKDRYHATVYKAQAAMLKINQNNEYTLISPEEVDVDTKCIQSVSMLDAESRIEEERAEERRLRKTREEERSLSEPKEAELREEEFRKGVHGENLKEETPSDDQKTDSDDVYVQYLRLAIANGFSAEEANAIYDEVNNQLLIDENNYEKVVGWAVQNRDK